MSQFFVLTEEGRNPEWLRPLLACGHFGPEIWEASSQWDFPDEALICPHGCGERQMDPMLQALLMDRAWDDGE
jgi:hypothetical protein